MELERAQQTWDAISRGDLAPLETLLAPDAKWRAVEDGPWNCENREMIMRVMGQNVSKSGLAGKVEDVTAVGDRTIVAFRPDRERDQWPLDDGIRYMVLTERHGMITEIKGCADKAIALAYAGSSAQPGVADMDHWHVTGFEAIFNVADVARSLEHYRRLGFTTSEHDETYAFVHRDDMTIHITHDDEGTSTGSTLYIHVDDAAQLAADWRAAGVVVVGPEDHDYGKREGSHTDPDGNLLRFGSPLPRT
jgi:ketosteroid isomerase-like protein/catechol 2,3-dioxygenase-like lactoylglutathione lyase family enzyme